MEITKKVVRFNKVLQSAKKALDTAGIRFHLHAGTALGAHREKSFIQHDHDIDLAVYFKDVNTNSQVNKLIKSMKENGFEVNNILGRMKNGKEIQFVKNNISLDIFWIYHGEYRGKKYYILASYFGNCDNLPHKQCIWGYRPYTVRKINFLGQKYHVVPKKTLVDMYGKDWHIPKKYGYFEGIEKEHYKGFLKDYYKPKPTNKKIAFCFLLYDTVKHNQIWEKFFKSDDYPIKSYNIYSHLKTVSDKTPKWIKNNKIKNIKTGWCEESLVNAWIKMLKEGLKDKNNQYFCLLSGECIPLMNFEKTYKAITKSNKSRINIDFNAHIYLNTGFYYADQWVILNRKHAKLLLNLKETQDGKIFKKNIKKYMCDKEYCYCPDEIYPVNWFVHKYGKPTSTKFKKEFLIGPSTYTLWKGGPHPIRFNRNVLKSYKKKICKSGAIFARKFNNISAKNISQSC